MDTITVKYRGVDDFNRAIFKDINAKVYYGSNEILFQHEERERVVKTKVTAKDLTYFGQHFNCEPFGSQPKHKIIIDWRI